MDWKKKLAVSGLSIALLSGVSYGSTADDNIGVSVTVNPYCEILNPVNDINMDYNPFEPISVSVGTINFRCVRGTDFTLSATSSNNPSGPLGIMVKDDDPTLQINYQLSATVNYGSSSASTSNLFANPISMIAPSWDPPSAFHIAVSFGGQPAPVGTYSDTVTINIAY